MEQKKIGVHPGGIFIVPENIRISDITNLREAARDDGVRLMVTDKHYRDVEKDLKKYDVLSKTDLALLREMEVASGFPVNSISMCDKGLMAGVNIDEGDSFLTDKRERQVFGIIRPDGFSDMVRMVGLAHADFFDANGAVHIEHMLEARKNKICCRDDIMEALVRNGCDIRTAYSIMNSISRGKGMNETMERNMRDYGLSDDYVGLCKQIRYLFPRSMIASYALVNWRMAYYKVKYPNEFKYAITVWKRKKKGEWKI